MEVKDYIKGARHGEEANRLERRAMEDPFLQDAIDGYDSVPGNHAASLDRLQEQLFPKQKKGLRHPWAWVAAAAVVIFLVAVPFLFRRPDRDAPVVAMSEISHRREEHMTTPPKQNDVTEEKQKVVIGDVAAEEKTQVVIGDVAAEEKMQVVIKNAVTEKETETGIGNAATEEKPRAVIDKKHHPAGKGATVVEGDHSVAAGKESETITTISDRPAVKEEEQVSAKRDYSMVTEKKQQDTAQKREEEGERAVERKERLVRTSAVATQYRAASPVGQMSAQEPGARIMTVSGRITDETGEPITGATVMLKKAGCGVVTDQSGVYSFTFPQGKEDTLVASYIGMKSVVMPITEKIGDITMKSDEMALNEVVVVAFGKQKKSEKVGAVASVKAPSSSFGEKEFRKFFRDHYDKTVCQDEPITIKATFYVNENGHISGIRIEETSCPAMVTEVKRLLLGSPAWSERNRKVSLLLEMPFTAQ